MTLSPGMNAPGFGVEPDDREAKVIARGAVACAGYCYPFAFINSNSITVDVSAGGGALTVQPGNQYSPYGNIVGGANAGNATNARCGRFCIPLSDPSVPIQKGASGKVKVKGLVKAYVQTTASAIAIGSELYWIASGASNGHPVLSGDVANTTSGAPKKYLALALEAVACAAASGTQNLILVDFDGWDGIGSGGNV